MPSEGRDYRLPELTPRDISLIGQSLRAAVEGPFFPDWEFATLMGMSRSDLARVQQEWPRNIEQDAVRTAVNNALNNLIGYPHGLDEAWESYISAPPAEIAEVLRRWRGEATLQMDTGGYFERME